MRFCYGCFYFEKETKFCNLYKSKTSNYCKINLSIIELKILEFCLKKKTFREISDKFSNKALKFHNIEGNSFFLMNSILDNLIYKQLLNIIVDQDLENLNIFKQYYKTNSLKNLIKINYNILFRYDEEEIISEEEIGINVSYFPEKKINQILTVENKNYIHFYHDPNTKIFFIKKGKNELIPKNNEYIGFGGIQHYQ